LGHQKNAEEIECTEMFWVHLKRLPEETIGPILVPRPHRRHGILQR
jgi:hypothetical protein